MPSITVHCIVKNEEKWIWFAIQSILDIAEKILIFDTGSTDNTAKIIKTIKDKKIIFEEKGSVDTEGLVDLRREQLKMTKTLWFLILDGDEIWPSQTKKELIEKLRKANQNDWGTVIRAWNLVGDIYHYHPESIHYRWPFAPPNYMGWANLRVIKTAISGLKIKGEYPQEAYCDNKNVPIQNYGSKHLIFLKHRYLHASYLLRSKSRESDKQILNRSNKFKFELGIKFSNNFKYPDAFYKKRPKIVSDPWQKRSRSYTFLSLLQSPIKETRRKILKLYKP